VVLVEEAIVLVVLGVVEQRLAAVLEVLRDLGEALISSGPAVEPSTPPSERRHLPYGSAMMGPRRCR
jgi:hypothetical protein